MAKGILITIAPDGTRTQRRIDHRGGPTLEDLHREVGGDVELHYVKLNGKIRPGYVDESGGFGPGGKQLEINPHATDLFVSADPLRRHNQRLRGKITIWVPDEK